MSATTTKTKTISAEEFDRRFDEGEDISDYIDWSKATRPGLALKRVNIDLPEHVIAKLDRAARLRGITRQALIKVLLFDAVDKELQGELDPVTKMRNILLDALGPVAPLSLVELMKQRSGARHARDRE